MATVNVDVHGRTYGVGCADGQEERVRQLAGQFDERVRDVASQVGQVGDSRLFLMAALILIDELQEAKTQLAKRPAAASPVAAPRPPAVNSEGVAEALNAVAARIEKIAQTL